MNRKDSPHPPAWTEPLRRGEGPSLRDTLSPPGGERDGRDYFYSCSTQVSSAVELFLLCRCTTKKQSQTVHHHDHRTAFVADHANRQRNFSEQRERNQHHHRAER